jgi:selenide,water dikinase
MENRKRLTEYSKGSGCGCKIQPKVLSDLLEGLRMDTKKYPEILVGNTFSDDASVYDLGNGMCLLQTVDFFTPMVDDPFVFGKAAAANAISDIYAMGGRPIMANAILGWPIDIIDLEMAKKVLEGGAKCCEELNIPLVGGHSIDSQDPIYGLSVTGLVERSNLRTNAMAKKGDLIALTKPLGIGMLAAAQKRGLADATQLIDLEMKITQVNNIGSDLAELGAVHAMTDVTGFGLIGHLMEILKASNVNASISGDSLPKIESAKVLAQQFVLPDNAMRNWNAYETLVDNQNMDSFPWLVDPQTNGGLLFTFSAEAQDEIDEFMKRKGQDYWIIGKAIACDPITGKRLYIV